MEDHYCGRNGYLTVLQEQELTAHLKTNIYQTVKQVVYHVKQAYVKTYSVEGMTHLLHRLGFVYKKTRVTPGKANLEKQEQFKEEYLALKKTKKAEDKIYFADAAHPHHNNEPFYGWIYKGEEKAIKTNTGRKRVNLNGALNLENMAITVLNEETINSYAVMRPLLKIEEKQPHGEIYLIIDNASYDHSYLLKLFLDDHPRVHLKYLPPYSPDLNIIERLWKFFHTKHHDKYFEKFKEFESDIHHFFDNIDQHEEKLRKFIGTELHLVKVTV